MNIVMIGSGNVATHLGAAIINEGHSILQVWSRDLDRAKTLADNLEKSGSEVYAINQFSDLITDADLYIISVADDGIEQVLKNMPKVNGCIVHTSGSTNMHVIAPFSTNYGVFYPLQTFSKNVSIDLLDTPILVEASNDHGLDLLNELALSISNRVQYCDSDQRMSLHLAAVFVCNFTNHLYAIGHDLLAEKNLDFDLIRPLIFETAQKVQRELPKQVQTGPAVRNDEVTMVKHLNQLQNHPEWLALYDTMSNLIAEQNKDKSIS